jgi:hypothetical protein
VTILYGGQQRAIGDINDLLRRRDVTEITTPPLSEDTIDQLRGVLRRLEQKDILGVSHPRVKLEDFFLRIVEEAQAQHIRTSGVLVGGEVPDFLKKPTEATTQEVVESLVAAAVHKAEPVPLEEAPGPVKRDSEPAREVLEQLLGGGGQEAEAEEPPAPLPAPSEPDRPRKPTKADSSVIDGLIQRADKESQKDEEGPA